MCSKRSYKADRPPFVLQWENNGRRPRSSKANASPPRSSKVEITSRKNYKFVIYIRATYSSHLWLPYVKQFRLWSFYDLFRPPSTSELFVWTILRLNSKLLVEEENFQILIHQRLGRADADLYQANLKPKVLKNNGGDYFITFDNIFGLLWNSYMKCVHSRIINANKFLIEWAKYRINQSENCIQTSCIITYNSRMKGRSSLNIFEDSVMELDKIMGK